MGIIDRIRQTPTAMKYAAMGQKLDNHLTKSCAYCKEFDMGNGASTTIIEFVEHLKEKHEDKIPPEELENYLKVFKV